MRQKLKVASLLNFLEAVKGSKQLLHKLCHITISIQIIASTHVLPFAKDSQ